MKRFIVKTVLGREVCKLYANNKSDAIAEVAYGFSRKNGYTFHRNGFGGIRKGRAFVKRMFVARAV